MSKIALLISALCILNSCVESKPFNQDKLDRIHKRCMQESGIKEKEVIEARDTLNLPNTPEYKLYINCLYKGQNFISEDGQVQYDNIEHFLRYYYSKEEARNTINKCRDSNSLGPEDAAYKVGKCIIASLREIEDDIKTNTIADS